MTTTTTTQDTSPTKDDLAGWAVVYAGPKTYLGRMLFDQVEPRPRIISAEDLGLEDEERTAAAPESEDDYDPLSMLEDGEALSLSPVFEYLERSQMDEKTGKLVGKQAVGIPIGLTVGVGPLHVLNAHAILIIDDLDASERASYRDVIAHALAGAERSKLARSGLVAPHQGPRIGRVQ